MAGDRTLKLSLLADVSNLSKNLTNGTKDIENFGSKVGEISEKAVKAFAAIGLAIAGVSVAFAKSAAEDEAAANKLASTIKAVTDATNDQIKAVENYVTQTAIATGVTDDQLRPAYERLIRSTKDVEEATKLLNLALDLSAATGKPLETVVQALARAYDGNTTALGKLGLGIDASLLKSKDFNAIYEILNTTFGEFSEKRSEEAIVKFQRLQVALDEAKEAVGAALLPAFEALGDWLLKDGVPRLNAFIAGLTGDKSLSKGFTIAQKNAENFGEKVRDVIDTVIKYKEVLITTAAVMGTIFAVSKVAAAIQGTITLINLMVRAYNALKTSAIVAAVAIRLAANPLAGAAVSAAMLAIIAGAMSAANAMDTKTVNPGGGETGTNLGSRPFGGIMAYGTSEDTNTSLIDPQTGRKYSAAELAGHRNVTSATTAAVSVASSGANATNAASNAAADATNVSVTIPSSVADIAAANAGQPINYGISAVPQAYNTAQVAAANNGITIVVNAPSIMDQEGFTRAVVDALNTSNRRAGSGGSQLVI